MDSEVEDIRNWFAYLMDARRGYIEALAKLPEKERTRDRGASYPTVLDVFAHSQGALYFWMKDVAKFKFPAQEGETDGPVTIEAIRKDEEYLRTQIQRVMSELTEADLSRAITRLKDRGSDHDCEVPVRDACWHLVEEELQHRGELNALFWQLDIDPPVFDWIEWAHSTGRLTHRPAQGGRGSPSGGM
jgi:uncharacterized damage-inducible protein DinB